MITRNSYKLFENFRISPRRHDRQGRINAAVITIFLLFISTTAIPLSAQPVVESNGKRILELSLQKMGTSRLLDSLSTPVYLTGNLCNEYRYEVTEYLLSDHKQVSSQSSSASRLSLQVTTSNQFQEITRNKAIRSINGGLTITLTDTTGIIKGMEHYLFASNDTVPSGLRNKLQSDWKPSWFDNGRKRRSWVVKRVLEPGLLLGAIGVTIYLLFNVRGN